MEKILLERMKLLMSYDTKKTLTENEQDFFEGRIKPNKAATKKTIKNIVATSEKPKKSIVDPNIKSPEIEPVKNAITNSRNIDLDDILDKLNISIKKGENPKYALDSLVTYETKQLEKKQGKEVTQEELEKIIKNIENKYGYSVKDGKKIAKSTTELKPATDVNEPKAVDIDPNLSKAEAIEKIENAAENVTDPAKKQALQKDKSTLARMSDKTFQMAKKNKKLLLSLGLSAATIYFLTSYFSKSGDDVLDYFDDCVIDLYKSNSSNKILYTSQGSPVIFTKTTGVQSYDNNGGLQFWTNKRVMIVNTRQMGTWSCNSGAASDVPIKNIKIVWDTKKSGGGNHRIKFVKNDSFPIKLGYVSDNVTKLQSALGITADGRFGYKTFAAIKNKLKQLNIPYNNQAIDEKLFNAIVNSSKPTPTDDKNAMDYYYDQYGTPDLTSYKAEPISGDIENLKSPEAFVSGKENLEKGLAKRKKELETDLDNYPLLQQIRYGNPVK